MLHLHYNDSWYSRLQLYTLNSRQKLNYVGFDVFTAVTVKNCVFWDTQCGPCKN
jgi:hypothetical protein